MERRAKERLIGASILVALLVLVVPELLSGPKPPAAPKPDLLPAQSASATEPVRTVTVDLATSKPTRTEPIESPPPASETAASVAPSAASQSAEPVDPAPPPTKSSNTPSAPSVNPPKTLESAGTSPTSRGGWSVQLGSFEKRANADALVQKLKAKGFQVYSSPTGSGSGARYRVRVGPLSDRAAAERTLAKLKNAGHAGALVSPGSR